MKPFRLFFLLTFTLTAQAESLSLQDALGTASQNSPEIQRSAAARDEAHWKRVENYSLFLPSVNAGATHLLDKKYVFTDIEFGGAPASIPGIVPTTTYGLNAEWSLFDGFASTNRYRASRMLETAAEREQEWAAFRVQREVTLQFYRALAAKTLQEVAANNLKTLQDHLNDTHQLRASGLSTNFDVLRVEVQVSEAESERMNADDNAELTKSKLAEFLGADKTVEPSGKLPELKPELVATAREGASRPDLAALAARVEGLGLQEAAADRHWIPRVSAFGSYTYYNNLTDRYDEWNRFRNAYQVGLQLQWNLFDGLRSTARDHQALAQKVQAEKTLRAQELKARQDLSFWTRKFKYFCSVSRARQNDIGKAKESVRLAREGRKVGARTNTDLLDAEAELFRAEAGAVNAQIGAIEALINVELSLGQPLYKFE